MAGNATLNIEVQAEVSQALRGLDNLKTTFNDFHTANQDAAGALGEFGISLTALDNPITAVASGIKASIDTTLQWGETIDKLTRATGLSAEQASKMAVVLGDFGISTDSLDKVVKTFTKNGLQFNLDTIKKLAVEYQSIKDPVERDKFAFANFGRSALEMNEILSKTPEELQAVGDKADYSGKIMSGAGVEAVKQFGVKTAELTDKLDGLKIAIGGPLVGVLSNAIDGFNGVVAVSNVLGIAIQQKIGILSDDQAAARADAAAHGDLLAEFHNVDLASQALAPTVEHLKDDTVELATNTNASSAAYEMQIPQLGLSAEATDRLAAATAANSAKVLENNALLAVQDGMMGQLTTEMIFQTAATSLDAAGQAELAVKLGLMNNNTYTAIQTVQAINKQLDEHIITTDQATTAEANLAAQNGLLTNTVPPQIAALIAVHNKLDVQASDFNNVAGAATTLKNNIHGIIDAEDALHDKSITITTHYQHSGDQSEDPNAGTAAPGRASGGPVFSGMPYTVGENGPELFVPRQSGTIVPNGAKAGGLTINVDARGSTDPSAVEDAGYRGAQRALSEAGYRADQLARMGAY